MSKRNQPKIKEFFNLIVLHLEICKMEAPDIHHKGSLGLSLNYTGYFLRLQ